MKPFMDWNPVLYLKFGDERTLPVIDLVNRIRVSRPPRNIIDIGCGPGNSGHVVLARWPDADFLGIDNSAAMIEAAAKAYPNRRWSVADAAQYESPVRYDLVFSNAALQWIPGHKLLLGRLAGLLSESGVVAIQLPEFHGMPVREAIDIVAQNGPWKDRMNGCRDVFTWHDYGFYYAVLSPLLPVLDMWETTYLHVLESQEAILHWVESTAMKPYLERLISDAEREEFKKEVLGEIRKRYPVQRDGRVIFPFRRLFMIGYKSR